MRLLAGILGDAAPGAGTHGLRTTDRPGTDFIGIFLPPGGAGTSLAHHALRETRSLAMDALAAPIAREIALTALAALGLSTDPFHDLFHARGRCVTPSCSLCAARHANSR